MNQIDNYIQSFLNGSLGAEGHTVLRQWIKEKPENRYYFQAQVAIWKATGVISNAEEFDVTLKEGAVKVGDFLIDAAPVELKPNQRFTLRKADLSMQVDSVDASHIDNWRNGAMTFDKVPLEEIAKELKRLYNIPIRIESDKLKQIVYYSDFQENVSVEKVLEILSSGNKFRYEIKSEEIRIFN